MKAITDEKRMIQNLVVEYERVADDRLPACSRKAGKLLETCCTVLDLQGVGPKTIWDSMDFLRKINQISSTYYPERLGKLLIINPPTLFNACFNTIKGFLDPVTVCTILQIRTRQKAYGHRPTKLKSASCPSFSTTSQQKISP